MFRAIQRVKADAMKYFKIRDAMKRGMMQYQLAKTPMFSVSAQHELAECTPISKRYYYTTV